MALLRRLAQEEGRPLAIMQDLQGPKVRLGEIEGRQRELREGERVTLTAKATSQGAEIPLPFPRLMERAQPGTRLLLADGAIELRVVEKVDAGLIAEALAGGVLKSRQGVNAPGLDLGLPSLTEKDKSDLAFGLSSGVDYVALSLVGRAEDVEELRRLMREGGVEVPIIAKVEKREAVEKFEEILEASDGVMVARGDLGVETPAEEVPMVQKEIIRRCNQAGKPVITATQMLESMIGRPRPTRAEASDVANAIFDGSDALMLSGETAIGEYPVKAVETMAAIARAAEGKFPYLDWARRAALEPSPTVTDAVSQATCQMAYELGAKAIITTTASGYTARMVAKYRPQTPILAVTAWEESWRRLALVWGVRPILVEEFANTDELISTSVRAAKGLGMVQPGDTVIITAGVPVGGQGRTNMIKVQVVE
jgi:pyruvate kinase